MASVVLAVLLSWSSTAKLPATAQQSTAKPNFVFVIADDMRKDDLKYMPKTRSLLKDKGMSFAEAFVTTASCCPSRATIMRGQYPHNTGVWRSVNSSDGGWKGYRTNSNEQDNVATRLDAAGYRTALLGKYFNGYAGTTYVPPGWDRWFATFNYDYFDYDVNDNGTIRHFGTSDRDYLTDVLTRQTTTFIGTSVAQGKPFFAYVAPIAPHNPATPAPRDLHAYDGEKAARPPSFNEKDVSDKPPWIRALPRMTPDRIAEIDNLHEKRAESLQALDDLVEGVINKLKSTRVMGNTYVVFTSDHGFQEGEHRIPSGKWRPYKEDIRVPLLVRGPGVAAASTHKLALNTDYFPTFAELAGIQTPGYVDGRSLRPVLDVSATTWRSAILLEGPKQLRTGKSSVPAYYGIRTSSGRKYVEYGLSNRYPASAPSSSLASRLQALKGCAGHDCRSAEGP